ncbi:MAG: 3-hydroxyacyl-CoA dehydrogenase NAD-binding domain-containing protein [Hydrogenophaga sp.]|uniref:3-hydroxyacyl-CoA dehydrogenase NAD-binding domain-containing protein n=1 Tax=Hydrogenophaga sp. TaxID=1904254 RepID=UPI00403704CD
MAQLPSVQVRAQGRVLRVTINNPPLNALNVDVRRGLIEAMDRANNDDGIDAVVIAGSGKNFIAGADIKEMKGGPVAPTLPEVCGRISQSGKPVVVALSGAVLGGGLEIAMSANYRLALSDARLGLPEVQIGLIPGSGGTQLAPRLMGVSAALDMVLSGKQLDSRQALASGLVDEVTDATSALDAGLACVERLLAQGVAFRCTRDLKVPDAQDVQTAVAEARTRYSPAASALFAPRMAVEAVAFGLDHPWDEAVQHERQLFLQCLSGPQHACLSHAFFAERQVRKLPGMEGIAPRPLHNIGIIGGGTMGAGIAVAVLIAGLPVTLVERDAQAGDRAWGMVTRALTGLVDKRKLATEKRDAFLANFSVSTSIDALGDCDLLIEAVFEDMAVKSSVFREMERVAKAGAILATNTSYLDVNDIAQTVSRPQDVIGLHFFSPAHVMKLLEIVVPDLVAQEVVATAFEFARVLQKVPVRAGVCDGFIGNRVLASYRQAADYMMEDGASPYAIDAALRNFGFPMGPFQVVDLSGGDVGWAARKRRAPTRDPRTRYVEIADRICEQGWFGQKTGRGFYRYAAGSRVGEHDPKVLQLIDAERKRKGIQPREFSEEEIVRRYMAAMVNEAANVVGEGIALRPLDVDVTFLHGYGFPRHKGGPMKHADTLGLESILSDIRQFALEDSRFWVPAPLLRELVEKGMDFGSLNDSQRM